MIDIFFQGWSSVDRGGWAAQLLAGKQRPRHHLHHPGPGYARCPAAEAGPRCPAGLRGSRGRPDRPLDNRDPGN